MVHPLDRDYMAWRAKQIKIGNIPKPAPLPYDPEKKLVPFLSEAQRKSYGSPSQLETEMAGFRRASKAKEPISLKRLLDVEAEVRRLGIEEADVAYSLQQQAATNRFIEQSYRFDERTVAGAPEIVDEIPGGSKFNFRKYLTKKNIAIAGGVLLAAGLLLPKEEHNTIAGLHPGSEGLGTQILRSHSDFGSGYQGILQNFIWFRRLGTRTSISAFEGTKFSGMPNSDSMAGNVRGDLTEFKSDFASRWDPMRKLAKELFEETTEKSAFRQLTEAPEFKGAIKEAMQGPGKLLGSGAQGQIHGYTAKMALGGKTHQFKFAAKSGYTAEEIKRLKPGRDPSVEIPTIVADIYSKASKEALDKEAQILGEVGSMRSPSLYGRTDDKVIMEMFEGLEELSHGKALSGEEAEVLTGFMKSAHSKGYSHTDLHGGNIVRVMGEGGKMEPAILDWGTANRFQKVREIGGESEEVWRLNEKIVSEESLRATGKSVDARQYSELSDLRRIKAHTSKASTEAEHLGVNSLIQHYNLVFSPNKTSEKVKVMEGEVQAAVREVFGNVSTMRPAVGEEIGTAAMRKPAGTAVAKRQRGTAALSGPKKTIKRKRGIAFADTVRQDPAFADTILKRASVRPESQAVNAYAKTAQAGTALQQTVRRNQKFRQNSTQAVGVGLRTAQNAGKGHTTYGSTKY